MVRGEGNETRKGEWVQGQVGEEVLMEVVEGCCGSMVEVYVQVDTGGEAWRTAGGWQ
jgi:hypothetical protein